MASKLITELPLRGDFDETVNFAGDDTIQTYRITGAQIRSYLEPLSKDQALLMKNVGLQISASAGAMTVALKQKNGSTDPASGINSTEISFRSNTITSPNRTIVPFDSALSLVIPSGATLGYANGDDARVFVYAYFDGTNKGLAVSARQLDENKLHSIAELNTSSDDFGVYGDASRSNAAVRLLGSFQINAITTAGTWTTQSEAALPPPPGFFPGMIMPFGGAKAPSGWLICNGSAISRTLYADLFSVIGTTFGVGNGSTTFNIPNAQGVVLRGAGTQTVNGRTKDGGARGAVLEDQMQRLTGNTQRRFLAEAQAAAGVGALSTTEGGANSLGGTGSRFFSDILFNSANSPSSRVSSTTDGETRVSSLSVNYVIKF